MTDPANGMVMAASILVAGCVGLSLMAFTLYVLKRHKPSARIAEDVKTG